jgi:hypothetical protein
MLGAFLGLLGAADLFLMAFYILGIYSSASAIRPIGQLILPAFLASALTITSAILLIYGSCLISKTRPLRGGIINLLAGTLVPIPTYVYFTFFSQPSMLGWLSPTGFFLVVPGILSGVIGISLGEAIKESSNLPKRQK